LPSSHNGPIIRERWNPPAAASFARCIAYAVVEARQYPRSPADAEAAPKTRHWQEESNDQERHEKQISVEALGRQPTQRSTAAAA
jgi:hypothetical protein